MAHELIQSYSRKLISLRSMLKWKALNRKNIIKITSWTATKLSYVGRVHLVTTMVLKIVEVYCKSYIRSGTNKITKRVLVSWRKMCLPKAVGGHLFDLRILNKVIVTKMCWYLANKQDRLWIIWIHAYYVRGKKIQNFPTSQHASWMVTKILEEQCNESKENHLLSRA
ncbi:hypothetical protein H5410_035906 [Solanum commersonii]|uniref:Uncharacterized protein n=1 Tax=Solanum commersonii TaxID=4109 RepID=A0A9J5Y3X2_SOLCO|nr:hypothetical protein H5410_035906 [Solanum commersonii]